MKILVAPDDHSFAHFGLFTTTTPRASTPCPLSPSSPCYLLFSRWPSPPEPLAFCSSSLIACAQSVFFTIALLCCVSKVAPEVLDDEFRDAASPPPLTPLHYALPAQIHKSSSFISSCHLLFSRWPCSPEPLLSILTARMHVYKPGSLCLLCCLSMSGCPGGP